MAVEDRQQQIQRQNIQACPVVHSLDIVGETWRLNVIHALQEGEKRFNELKRATHARSRTLSQTLETLMENGLVNRRMEEDAPVAVYYSLTEKGRALAPVFDELENWADEWLEDDWDTRPRERSV
jgi:DNA-binding HxlR family transcriptional regulator